MKILVFTTDIIPLPGMPTSGTALRTFGLIQGLRAFGHEVIVSVPRSAIEGLEKSFDLKSLDSSILNELNKLKELSFDAASQNNLLAQTGPDVVLCGHWPAMGLSTRPSQALIVDLAGPHMLERHYQGAENQIGAALGKLGVMATADYFIVSGPKQRLYFLSYLLRAKVDSPEKRIVEVTMPMNPALPPRQRDSAHQDNFPNFVFGGVFLPWQNPAPALRQVKDELVRRGNGQLALIGGKHPNYQINEGVYAKLFRELDDHPSVISRPMLPYEQFIGELGQVDAAIDLMQWNLERELAVTIRSTSYLWAGVPVIYNDFADLGRLIRKYDAGWCIPPDNKQALAAVLDEIYESPALVSRKSENAQRLAREVFSWDIAVRPLLDFLTKPETKRLRETDIIMDFPDSAAYPLCGTEIEQYFLCRIHGLNRIEFRLATHNQVVNHPLELELYEVDSGGEYLQPKQSRALKDYRRKLLTRETIQGRELRNNEWHTLDFSPQSDSAGKAYVLRLAAEKPAESETSSVSPWIVKGSPYPLLGFFYKGEQIEHAALCLRTTCAGKSVA